MNLPPLRIAQIVLTKEIACSQQPTPFYLSLEFKRRHKLLAVHSLSFCLNTQCKLDNELQSTPLSLHHGMHNK
jgi:hypothetical protein